MRIDVRTNAALVRAQVELDRRELLTATRDSLNRAAEGIRTDGRRKIAEDYNVTQKAIAPAFRVTKATVNALTSRVTASGRPLSLINFNAKWRRAMAGAEVEVKRRRKKTITHSFIARMKNGHLQVMIRKERGGSLVARFPIKKLTTLAVPDMLRSREVMSYVEPAAIARFEKAIDQNIRRMKGRRNG